METITQEKAFKPHTELMVFAADFAKNYKELKSGSYYSKEKKFHIEYRHNTEFGAPEINLWRVETQSQTIQISIDTVRVPEILPDFIFFMIIWSGVYIHNKNTFKIGDLARADMEALQYYFTTGREPGNIAKGYLHLFSKISVSELNISRLKKILSTIQVHEELKPKQEFSFDVDRVNKIVTLFPQHLFKKSYTKFIDGELKPADIRMTDILMAVQTNMKKRYLSKGFKIYFGFKKDVFLLEG